MCPVNTRPRQQTTMLFGLFISLKTSSSFWVLIFIALKILTAGSRDGFSFTSSFLSESLKLIQIGPRCSWNLDRFRPGSQEVTVTVTPPRTCILSLCLSSCYPFFLFSHSLRKNVMNLNYTFRWYSCVRVRRQYDV